MKKALLNSGTVVLATERFGRDFLVVGDFGWVRDMSDPNLVFDAINATKMNAVPNSNDDAEFFVTVGDNLYPVVETAPTDEEFATMMTLFEREHLKDLPVWAVRGNHDCYFDANYEIEKSDQYEQWNLPSLYYAKEIEIGQNGEKMGILMVDSCLMLCANWSFAGDSGGHMLLMNEQHKRLRDVVCNDSFVTAQGNAQYDWIQAKMEEWE